MINYKQVYEKGVTFLTPKEKEEHIQFVNKQMKYQEWKWFKKGIGIAFLLMIIIGLIVVINLAIFGII